MRHRFYVSDLDGTLLNKEGVLSANTRQKLLELLDKGLRFTIATARGIHSVQPLFRDIPLAFPVVELNGAMITDIRTGKHLQINALEAGIVPPVLELFIKEKLPPVLINTTGEEDFLHYFKPIEGRTGRYLADLMNESGDRFKEVRHPDDVLAFRTASLNCFERKSHLEPVYREILRQYGDRVKLVFYDDHLDPEMAWLSVYDKKATKDLGIRTVLELHDIHPDHVTVFGDQSNDLPMFEAFSHAVAVENAIPELKKNAREVIGHHADDSVVSYLYGIFSDEPVVP